MKNRPLFAVMLVAGFVLYPSARADFDFGVSAFLRSFPLSGTLGIEGGYNHLIWGRDPRTNESPSPLYGFARPSLFAATSGLYNSGGVQLEIFPVSFAGMRIGAWLEHSIGAYSGIDCTRHECSGLSQRRYIEVPVGAAIGPVFAGLAFKLEGLAHQSSAAKPFIEPEFSLPARSTYDNILSVRTVLGAGLGYGIRVFYLNAFARMDALRGYSTWNYLVGQYSDGPWKMTFGAGVFSSSLRGAGISAIAGIKWTLKQGIGII
ncbi:MAG: hypothetical protein A2583_03355 [Bdellovibrionales bacterium RIFOXYD1_FULL_53_11]|nr:MAG: hypothetical protein A2583_03355 [Bdellovibrionales bacterium RIFOXYD1_FULL_53_11]